MEALRRSRPTLPRRVHGTIYGLVSRSGRRGPRSTAVRGSCRGRTKTRVTREVPTTASTRARQFQENFRFLPRRDRFLCRTRGVGTRPGLNQSEHERTAVVCRYGPWWLSGNEFGNLHSGGHTLRTYVPREVFAKFSPELKLLYRHIAEGEEDVLQPENQHKALRARFCRSTGTAPSGPHRRQQPHRRRGHER